MTDVPKIRRFRFSLRSLFIVLTACCIGLGWLVLQKQQVSHRQAMRKQIVASAGSVFDGHIVYARSPQVVLIRDGYLGYEVPKIRALLGDQTIHVIGFNRQLSDDDRKAIEAFPEAQIYAIPD